MTEATAAWRCPKDGTAMQAMGRRAGGWRCPACRGIFIDTEAIRHGRAGAPPAWAPMLVSVVMSLLVTAVVRRLRRRRTPQASA